MLNNFARAVMFCSSYAPLALIFLVLYAGRDSVVAIVAAAVLLLGVSGLLWFLHTAKTDVEPATRTVVDYRRRGDEVMGYVAAYLIPFVGFTLRDVRQDVALVIFFLVLAYLYVSTDMLHINPTLRCLGYHVYEVTFENGRTQHLITKAEIARNDVVKVARMDHDLWIESV
ncbi:MAG: hypothetical protein OJF49_001056 [Ktedonobacterales bacterium]|jgi:hypothetical protein|nr:MAG: hypothetical protein OJF49_001056 [Ktedonobacterales bacterium]